MYNIRYFEDYLGYDARPCADYDGQVFNISLADVPERKKDLVEGKYIVETS